MTATVPTLPATEPWTRLTGMLRSAAALESVGSLIGWDQETKMPPRAAPFRAVQSAELAGVVHARRTDPALNDAIAACEAEAPEPGSAAAAALRRIRLNYDKAAKLPDSLVRELAETTSRAQDAWKDARAKNDFPAFAPWLEKVVSLTRRKAECLGVPETADGGQPAELYDALFDEYEPGARAAEVAAVFKPLRERLSALVQDLLENGTPPDSSPAKISVPEPAQHAFGETVLKAMGFDFTAGRLDTTAHPFCSSPGPADTRLTTRYDDTNWPDALYSTMHEGGHGLYEQGLPAAGPDGEPTALLGTPLAESAGLGTHESQSRLWENCVGRSEAFWTWALPEFNKATVGLLKGRTPADMNRAVNSVERSYIRVDADEATYNLHVMLRFELERALITGDLSVNDLPAAWNDGFKDMLGIDVPDDRRGCLQDVHWSFGLIGYFATYTLGNLMAAQLWAAARKALPTLDADIANGEMAGLLAWLRTNIHAHGMRYSGPELCEMATGFSLTPDPLYDYLSTKLRMIYS